MSESRSRFSIKRFLKNYSASHNVFRNLAHSLSHKNRETAWDGVGVKLLDRKLRDPYGVSDQEFDSTWAAAATQLAQAFEESNRINAKFVLLYFPSKEEVYWEFAKEKVSNIENFVERIDRLRKTVVNYCESRKLLCLDLSPALKARARDGEILYFPIDIHWNEKGNLLVAQEIHNFLVRNNIQ